MDVVLFGVAAFAALMGVVALAVPASRRIGMPLPVMLAAIGLAYGFGASAMGMEATGGFLDAYDLWFLGELAFSPSALLIIFLPPLLFQMALAVNVRRLVDDWAGVVVFAIVAVGATTIAVGLAVWQVSAIGLVACLMLGAAVATTDPSAVITTFRELGAPRRLLVMLEGESLLNDAAAIAIFALLLGVAQSLGGTGAAPSVMGVVTNLAWAIGGGAAIGLAAAWGAAQLYPVLGRSAAAEAALTIGVAYGAYILSESLLGASGVVSVVFAGLMTGTQGFVRMGPGNWSTVQVVWDQIGFVANGLILLLVASVTPGLLLGQDWGLVAEVLVVFLSAFAARALMVFGAMPALARLRLAEPMERAQQTLVVWGGVRGAVTLVLALSLSQITAFESLPGGADDAPRAAALAAGFTLLTLFLNAATLGWVTSLLGLDRLSESDVALRERIVAGSIARVRRLITEIGERRAMTATALAETRAILDAEAQSATDAGEGVRVPFGDRLRLGAQILAGQEARLVRRAFEEGAIGPKTTLLLRTAAERIGDAARRDGRQGYARACAAEAIPPDRYARAMTIFRLTGWDGPLRTVAEQRLTAFFEAERILRELQRFADQTLSPMIGEDAAANLSALLAERLETTEDRLDAFGLQYPNYRLALERALIARTALRRERQEFERLARDAVIGPELLDDLLRELDRRERALARPPRLDLTLRPIELLSRVPLFAGLDDAQRRRLARRLRTRFTAPGEVVARRGERGTDMAFIASGSFEVRGVGEPQRISNGAFFGALTLIRPLARRRTDIVSLGFCRVLVLRRADFLRLVRRDPEIGALIQAAAERQASQGVVPGVLSVAPGEAA